VVAAGCDHRDFAAEHNEPISFPEYGLGEQGTRVGGGGDDPYFIGQLAQWNADSGIAYHGHRPPLVELPDAQREYLEAFGG
jgi:hypothetical protein